MEFDRYSLIMFFLFYFRVFFLFKLLVQKPFGGCTHIWFMKESANLKYKRNYKESSRIVQVN